MTLRVDSLVDQSGGSPLLLPLDSIEEDPAQPRTEFDDESLGELAQTIKARGVRQPISVRPHSEEPGRWVLNFGARRLRASRLAGLLQIPAFVDAAFDTYDQVIENEQREGLKPIELARFVKVRMQLGESQAEVARSLGKSESYVAHVRALVDAPQWLMDVYRRGQCKGMMELYQLRGLHEQAPVEVQQWIAGTPTIGRSDLQRLRATLRPCAPTEAESASQGPSSADPRGQESVRTDARSTDTAALSRSTRTAQPERPKFGLFAEHEGQLVEILATSTPDDRDEVFVRAAPGMPATRCLARSLQLVGFRPVAAS